MKYYKFNFGLKLLFAICFLSLKINCQIQKGNYFIEPNVSSLKLSKIFNLDKSESTNVKYESKVFSFSLIPKIGYFISNRSIIGISFGSNNVFSEINYFNLANNISSTINSKSIKINLSPFFRQYLNKDMKYKLYVEISCGVGQNLLRTDKAIYYNEDKNIYLISKSKYNGYFYSGESLFGLNYFFNEKIAFNVSVGYNFTKEKLTKNVIDDFTISNFTNNSQIKYNTINHSIVWLTGFNIFF